MHISILTLFPDMFVGPLSTSIIKRAIEKDAVTINYINIRDFAENKYKTVDGHPYGGGAGMILRVDVVDRAIQHVLSSSGLTRGPALKNADSRLRGNDKKYRIVLLDPAGVPYKQSKAKELSVIEHLILVCAHYEGIDDRVRSLVDEEISIGDYIVTGGELPAMILADSVIRLLPNVLKKQEATTRESFTDATLEYPQYTEPRSYNGMDVPEVLLGGNHANIAAWQKEQSEERTRIRRPDLALLTE